jgi:hypothetical protein
MSLIDFNSQFQYWFMEFRLQIDQALPSNCMGFSCVSLRFGELIIMDGDLKAI